jgi:methyl-accepting chemotaxis protein
MRLGYLLLVSFGTVILLISLVGWLAVSYSNQVSESLGVSSSVPQLLLISEIIILVLGLFVGYFTSRMISKPLTEFSSAVDEISKGNFNVQIPEDIGEVSEIKSLSNSLDRVMTTMKLAVEEKESIKIPKQKTAVKTKKLNKPLEEVKND